MSLFYGCRTHTALSLQMTYRHHLWNTFLLLHFTHTVLSCPSFLPSLTLSSPLSSFSWTFSVSQTFFLTWVYLCDLTWRGPHPARWWPHTCRSPTQTVDVGRGHITMTPLPPFRFFHHLPQHRKTICINPRWKQTWPRLPRYFPSPSISDLYIHFRV